MIKIDYNLTGNGRKKLVQTISAASGSDIEYLGTPSCGYQVGPYFISKEGMVGVPEDEPSIKKVLDAVREAGFTGTYIGQEEQTLEEEEETFIGSISVTKEGMTPVMIENLKKIIAAKACLIKKAFGVQQLPVLEESDQITFEWFPDMTPDNGPAYMEFISRLRTLAMETKRVTMKEKTSENEKYAWRCFLLRLGFIGPEYKETRKILMRNFTGSSAFKNGTKKEDTADA